MKKIALLGVLALVGCLQTTTHKVPMKREGGDLWWRDRVAPVDSGSTATVTSPCASDEEYFEEKTVRWPDDWEQKHPAPAPEPAPAPMPSTPNGELY